MAEWLLKLPVSGRSLVPAGPALPGKGLWRVWLPRAWLACGVLLAALLASQSLPGGRPDLSPGVADSCAAGETPSPSVFSRKAIADVRVGDRVCGLNPLGRDARDRTGEPEPAGWRLLRLRLSKREGGSVAITLLRPLAWFREQQAKAGGTLWLDLEELDACGEARVLAIEPCPPIAAGPGEVVTGTFAHDAAGGLLEVRLQGQAEPLVCTARHPFWSEERKAFVAAGQLKAGERLRGRSGPVAVDSVAARPGSERVYNLEVRGEHVYQVSALGLLVHNNSAGQNASTPGATSAGPGSTSASPAPPTTTPNAPQGAVPAISAGKIRALAGARPATQATGNGLAARAKDFYRPLTAGEKQATTIGVTRVKINGEWKEVVSVNGGAPPSVVKKVQDAAERQGAIFRQAPGREHPDVFLHREFGKTEGFEAIGVSHAKGPCSSCQAYFEQQGFKDVYWDSTFVK